MEKKVLGFRCVIVWVTILSARLTKLIFDRKVLNQGASHYRDHDKFIVS